MPYAIGPLIVAPLTGSASLWGLVIGVLGLSRWLVAYLPGKIAGAYGAGLLTVATIGVPGVLLLSQREPSPGAAVGAGALA